ncbi:DUF6862 domain-containing protein, partial [Erwinia sp. AnSW2-5]|uniref:DUF6862 domain-containing protein n=1 Tax=Erwinia sp. AnSW2-5 TaxID=3367692 RepID=UPI0038591269
GKNAVENNALSAPDDKTRQDAKWSLPYLEGDKKTQAENLVADMNAKDKAFNAAIDAACKKLSSAQCQGMRQELAAMSKSYDEQLDGQYIGNMGSVYKEGKGQVDALMWQYATTDAKTEREVNINRIAENWGVSKETAATLYDGMAVVHTTAAIGGAVYGMKGESIPVAKGRASASETYFRVEGGGSGTKTSQNRISANADGSVTINSGCSGQLCVSTNGPNHASYYLTNKRADGSVVVFEVDAALHKQIMDAALPQKPIPGVPRDPNAPKIVDPNKGEPSVSLELPKVWDRLIEQNSSKARVLTKEAFMNEFGK